MATQAVGHPIAVELILDAARWSYTLQLYSKGTRQKTSYPSHNEKLEVMASDHLRAVLPILKFWENNMVFCQDSDALWFMALPE